jgi:hypothetical protein
MNANERKLIEQQIRNLQELINNASKDNPKIKEWQQQIANYKARLTF